jgi:hypothetical protein
MTQYNRNTDTHGKNQDPGQEPVPTRCPDPDYQTQKYVNTERNKYCIELYDSRGATAQQETKFKGEEVVLNEKKCMFNNTEDNYQRYRNLDMTVGAEVTQTADSIKANVDKLKKWNTDLSGVLKKINKSLTDVKGKFGDLRDAGCKLESSIKDKCFSAQWKALTGKTSERCKDKPVEPHPACKDAAEIIEDLICKPKGLIRDIDSLFQSSADVVGIQVFSSIERLEPLQKGLDQYAKDFAKLITDTAKTREADLKKLQEELIKTVKELTKSGMDRNSLRSDFEGYYDAVRFLCCPCCDCLPEEKEGEESTPEKRRVYSGDPRQEGQEEHQHPKPDDDCYNDCPPRLDECEEAICVICEEVEKAFCCREGNPIPHPRPNPKPKPEYRGCCDD